MGKEIEAVDNFIFLGSIENSDTASTQERNRRTETGKSAVKS